MKNYEGALYQSEEPDTTTIIIKAIEHFAEIYTILPEFILLSYERKLRLPFTSWECVFYGPIKIFLYSPHDNILPPDIDVEDIPYNTILCFRRKAS